MNVIQDQPSPQQQTRQNQWPINNSAYYLPGAVTSVIITGEEEQEGVGADGMQEGALDGSDVRSTSH